MKRSPRAEYQAILDCLITWRKRANITQQRLAAHLGMPQSIISKVERGKRRLEVVEFLRILYALAPDPRPILEEILRATPSLRARTRRRPAASGKAPKP